MAQGTSFRARAINPRTPAQVWASNLWAHYRIRPSDYYRIMREQDNRCAICGIHDRDAPDDGLRSAAA